MTDLEQRILDIIQDGFPIAERPYAVIASMLDERTEQQVFDVVESLRSSGVIRRLGGVYDTKRLGLVSRLCAGKVPESPLDFSAPPHEKTPMEIFAAKVAEIPAITHNYIRSHEYNVWFTVIAENEAAVQAIIDSLCRETSLHDTHAMAAKKMFKINTVMRKDERRVTRDERNVFLEGAKRPIGSTAVLTDADKARIRLLSGNLPHTLTPFNDLLSSTSSPAPSFMSSPASSSMSSPASSSLSSPTTSFMSSPAPTGDLAVFLAAARDDLASKRMRRFGAVLRHQEAGFPCNAMVCFNVDERRESRDERNSDVLTVAEAGAMLANNPHVSHCYERSPFEGFPYNVYAMFHGESDAELSRYIAEAVASLGNPEHAILHSLKELKKTSYKYFAV